MKQAGWQTDAKQRSPGQCALMRSVEKNGSLSLEMRDGGECDGATFISEEKVGGKLFDNSNASRRLNLSDHFWSNSSIFLSVDLSTDFLDFEVDDLSFLGFLSGGEETEGVSVTGAITDTVDGSTKVLSFEGEESSAFLASRFSVFNLYDGVAS